MRHHFSTEQWLPYPLPGVFAFFANPQNLPPLMPAWQKTRLEEANLVAPQPPPPGSPARLGTGVGTTMVLTFRALPLVPFRIAWHVLIPEFEWNDHFCDVQTSGPFDYWRHCHRVQAQTRNGVDGTLVRDEVEYELPGGPLGDLANLLGGRLQMRYVFSYRHRQTSRLLPMYLQRFG